MCRYRGLEDQFIMDRPVLRWVVLQSPVRSKAPFGLVRFVGKPLPLGQELPLEAGVGAMLEKAGLGVELPASGGGISAGLLKVSESGGRVEVGGAG